MDHPYLASCYYHLLDDNRFIPCSHDYWISAQTCLYIAEQGPGSNGCGSQVFLSLYPVPHTSGSIRPAPTLEKKAHSSSRPLDLHRRKSDVTRVIASLPNTLLSSSVSSNYLRSFPSPFPNLDPPCAIRPIGDQNYKGASIDSY